MKINYFKIQDSWLKTFVFLLVLAFYSIISFHKIELPTYDDLPRQIKIGEEVIQGNFNILYKNTFSYVEPDQTFYNHHWLSGVIFYLLFIFLGWNGIVLVKVLVLLLFFSLLFFTALKKADFWVVALASIPTLIILSERTALRPEIFSYLFISIFLYILFHFRDNPNSKLVYALVPLQILWVNMHVLFSIGIMLAGGFLFESLLHNHEQILLNLRNSLRNNPYLRKLAIVFMALVLVSFLNPRGIGGVFYRYSTSYPVVITEFQTLSQFERGLVSSGTIQLTTFKICVFLLLVSFLIKIFYLYKKKELKIKSIPVFYLLSSIATIYIGFRILRGVTLFAVIFLIVFSDQVNYIYLLLRDKLKTKYRFLPKAAFILLLLVLIFIPNVRSSISPYSVFGSGLVDVANDSINFFNDNNLKGPIFNDSDSGSYLIYNLYPKYKVFADNRFGDAYSVEYGKNTYLPVFNDEGAWLEVSKKYDFQTIFLYQYGAGGEVRNFIWRRFRDPAWVLVYVDRYNVIFVRNIPENKDLIEKYGFNQANAPEKLKDLINSDKYIDLVTAADLLNLVGQNDFAQNVFLEVVYKWPEKGHIWMIMGQWEVAIDQYRSHILAIMYLERAISLGYRTSEVYAYLGMAYNKLGQTEKAIEALEKSIKINPDRRDAKDLLYQMAGRTGLE
ncbi:MAG: tetratricopeptide repeat protein [Minisyncoccia bacterium]